VLTSKHVYVNEIAITCSEMLRVFYRKGRYSVLVVDGLLRSYTILDMQMYKANDMLDNMWRHWMPGSFAVSALIYCVFCTSRISNMPFGNTMLATRYNSMKICRLLC
jgi:hypothetical protein